MLHRAVLHDFRIQTEEGWGVSWAYQIALALHRMYSSREISVKHIQNIHGGNANFVSFVHYLEGRNFIYWSALPPTYQKKNDVKRLDYSNIMKSILQMILLVC